LRSDAAGSLTAERLPDGRSVQLRLTPLQRTIWRPGDEVTLWVAGFPSPDSVVVASSEFGTSPLAKSVCDQLTRLLPALLAVLRDGSAAWPTGDGVDVAQALVRMAARRDRMTWVAAHDALGGPPRELVQAAEACLRDLRLALIAGDPAGVAASRVALLATGVLPHLDIAARSFTTARGRGPASV
jgi:hypothetical protein